MTVGAASNGVQVITGAGNSASLTLGGGTALSGSFATGTLTFTAQLYADVVIGAGGSLGVSGNAVISPGVDGLTAHGLVLNGAGRYTRAGALSIVGYAGGATVDAASTLEVGNAGGAATGTITIDVGATLSITGTGSFGYTQISAPTIVNHGTLSANQASPSRRRPPSATLARSFSTIPPAGARSARRRS